MLRFPQLPETACRNNACSNPPAPTKNSSIRTRVLEFLFYLEFSKGYLRVNSNSCAHRHTLRHSGRKCWAIPFIGMWGIWLTTGLTWTITAIFAFSHYQSGTWKSKLLAGGKDCVVAILSGDLLAYARSIAAALKKSPETQILWVTGMGIHHEVPGEVGKLLDALCRQMSEYVEAADAIASSGNPCTLIRAAHLTDGSNAAYYVQHEGEPLHANRVDRIAVASLINDLLCGKVDAEESIGVTN